MEGARKKQVFPLQRGSDVAERESRVKVKVSPSKTDRQT